MLKSRVNIRQVHSSNRGQRLFNEDVILIILQYTGLDSAGKAIQWFCTEVSRKSTHYLVAKDGAVTQLVAPKWVSWHAPRGSSWEGYTNLNNRAVGVSLDCMGPLYRDADGFARPIGSSVKVPNAEVFHGKHKFGRASFTEWELYREEQLSSLDELLKTLVPQFPNLKAIVGADDCSPFSHLAPGPALPAQFMDLGRYR
jgi:N-acetylmuramoyl-L-alanine amidase